MDQSVYMDDQIRTQRSVRGQIACGKGFGRAQVSNLPNLPPLFWGEVGQKKPFNIMPVSNLSNLSNLPPRTHGRTRAPAHAHMRARVYTRLISVGQVGQVGLLFDSARKKLSNLPPIFRPSGWTGWTLVFLEAVMTWRRLSACAAQNDAGYRVTWTNTPPEHGGMVYTAWSPLPPLPGKRRTRHTALGYYRGASAQTQAIQACESHGAAIWNKPQKEQK